MKGRNRIILITVFGMCISASLTFGINLKFWEWGKEKQKAPELKPVAEKTVVAEEPGEKDAPVIKKVETPDKETAAEARGKRKEAFEEARETRKEVTEDARETRKETDKEAREIRKGGKKEAKQVRNEARGEAKEISTEARNDVKAAKVQAKADSKIKKVEAKTDRKLGRLGEEKPEGEEKEPVIKEKEPEVTKTGKVPVPVLKRDEEAEKKIQKPVFRKEKPVDEGEIN